MKILYILLLVTFFSNATSFSNSKFILSSEIYTNDKKSFYCQNPYELKKIKGKWKNAVIPNSNTYSARKPITKKGKTNLRAKRIEWEHVMPAHNFGRHLACWRKGGRKECRKDEVFKTMEADMHNLVPAIGEVNGDRLNYKFAADMPKEGMYGNCKFSVDFKLRRAYVSDDIKGDIARIYFYMSDRYNINLSKQERNMMQAWDKSDPISQWEFEKNRKVFQIQGNSNKFIENLERR